MTTTPQDNKAAARPMLERALVRLDGGRAWTRDEMARNSDGKFVHPQADDACSWCAIGALISLRKEIIQGSEMITLQIGDAVFRLAVEALADASGEVPEASRQDYREKTEIVMRFNDNSDDPARVIAAFQSAIESLGATPVTDAGKT